MTVYRVSMEFENGTKYSFLEREQVMQVGQWASPYPNTEEDNFSYDFIESHAQSEGVLATLFWEAGEPTTLEITEVEMSN